LLGWVGISEWLGWYEINYWMGKKVRGLGPLGKSISSLRKVRVGLLILLGLDGTKILYGF
jgi:hypothetical protein